MKFYYSPNTCSLACHIALHEAGLEFEPVAVDIGQRRTASGDDYTAINAKGYVPALILDDDQLLTENIAILDWIAQQSATLQPATALARTRLIEMLAFLSMELHKPFVLTFTLSAEEDRAAYRDSIAQRFALLADRMQEDYLLGRAYGVADAWLYVLLRWAEASEIPVPDRLRRLHEAVGRRASTRRALREQGLVGWAETETR